MGYFEKIFMSGENYTSLFTPSFPIVNRETDVIDYSTKIEGALKEMLPGYKIELLMDYMLSYYIGCGTIKDISFMAIVDNENKIVNVEMG